MFKITSIPCRETLRLYLVTALYQGGPGLKSQPKDGFSGLRFLWFSSVSQSKFGITS